MPQRIPERYVLPKEEATVPKWWRDSITHRSKKGRRRDHPHKDAENNQLVMQPAPAKSIRGTDQNEPILIRSSSPEAPMPNKKRHLSVHAKSSPLAKKQKGEENAESDTRERRVSKIRPSGAAPGAMMFTLTNLKNRAHKGPEGHVASMPDDHIVDFYKAVEYAEAYTQKEKWQHVSRVLREDAGLLYTPTDLERVWKDLQAKEAEKREQVAEEARRDDIASRVEVALRAHATDVATQVKVALQDYATNVGSRIDAAVEAYAAGWADASRPNDAAPRRDDAALQAARQVENALQAAAEGPGGATAYLAAVLHAHSPGRAEVTALEVATQAALDRLG